MTAQGVQDVQALISAADIQARVQALAGEIRRDHPHGVHLVCVLKGAFVFLSDLSRALANGVTLDFIAVSSYGQGSTSSGQVQLLKDLDSPIEGRDVVIVEDIVDTGLTLAYLIQNLKSRGPASIEVMAMFRKPEALRSPVEVKYVGFDLPNEFVVGYGLDYAGRYRNLRDVGTLSPHVYS